MRWRVRREKARARSVSTALKLDVGFRLYGDHMRKWLVQAPSEFVAELIYARLADAGVQSLSMNRAARPSSLAGERDIYVDEKDLEDARKIVRSAEVLDDDGTKLGE
jgi:hypothetical protein